MTFSATFSLKNRSTLLDSCQSRSNGLLLQRQTEKPGIYRLLPNSIHSTLYTLQGIKTKKGKYKSSISTRRICFNHFVEMEGLRYTHNYM